MLSQSVDGHVVRVRQEVVPPPAGVCPGLRLESAHVIHHLPLHDVEAGERVLLRVVTVSCNRDVTSVLSTLGVNTVTLNDSL